MTRLQIISDGQTLFDADVLALTLNVQRDLDELVSDPALAAALAGAPPDVISDLPGRMVAYNDMGSDVELTLRWRKQGSGVGEFRPAFGR
jgi:hypothetical protein